MTDQEPERIVDEPAWDREQQGRDALTTADMAAAATVPARKKNRAGMRLAKRSLAIESVMILTQRRVKLKIFTSMFGNSTKPLYVCESIVDEAFRLIDL